MRILLIAVLAVSATVSLRSAELTTRERSRLVAHLEMTGSWLTDEVSNLSQEQLVFRPTSDAWSIMEVIDHLVVVHPIYFDDLQNALKGPAGQRFLRRPTPISFGMASTAPTARKPSHRNNRRACATCRARSQRTTNYTRASSTTSRRPPMICAVILWRGNGATGISGRCSSRRTSNGTFCRYGKSEPIRAAPYLRAPRRRRTRARRHRTLTAPDPRAWAGHVP